jgi:hypothetical protein
MNRTTETLTQNTLARVWFLVPLLIACAGCHLNKHYMGGYSMNGQTEPMIPAITVESEAQYVLEFPILVAIILHNETIETDYLNLPRLGLLYPLDSIAVDLQPVNSGPQIRLGPSFAFRDQNLFRTELMAGQTMRMLIDLSQFGQSLSAGQYQLKVSIFERPGVSRSSSSVKVEFLEPSVIDRTEAARLRRLGLRNNSGDFGSWQPFLTSNWNTVSLSPSFSEKASHQLALHFALHRAAYGPEPLSRFPVEVFQRLRGPVLSAEAASLVYELLVARGDKNELETARSSLLKTWADLKARLDQIDNGEGLLNTLRKGYGIEKDPPLPPGKHPYTIPGQE